MIGLAPRKSLHHGQGWSGLEEVIATHPCLIKISCVPTVSGSMLGILDSKGIKLGYFLRELEV